MLFKNKYPFILALIILSMFISSCKENSNPTEPQTPHFEAEGLIIQDATKKIIFAVFQGNILKDFGGNKLLDTLIAPLNVLSDHYSVKFLDANKNIINPPTDNDHSFGYDITDKTMLQIIQDDPKDYAFHLKGLKLGVTTIELRVNHNGHPDFKTPKIPVKVIVDTTRHGEPVGVILSYEENGVELVNASDKSFNKNVVIPKDTTEHIKIEFYDENGKKFQPEYPLHNFTIEILDNTLVSYIKEADEPLVLRFIGKKLGQTQFKLKLLVNGVAEFTTANINIEVR